MKVLVVAAQRSGTGYAAALLTASGNPCTHEGQYNLERFGPLERSESSWLAVPWLSQASAEADRVVHLVRHPLMSVASSLARKTFAAPNPYGNYAVSACPDISEAPTELERVMRYWWRWNQLICEYGADLVRLEEIADSNRVNADPRSAKHPLRWADLPTGRDRLMLRSLANRFGYE